MTESRFKDSLKRSLKSQYKYLYFDKVVQTAGTGKGRPDLEVVGSHSLKGEGFIVKIETKTRNRKIEPAQEHRALSVCSAGGVSVFARLTKDEKHIEWSTLGGDIFKVTTLHGLNGILEACKEACAIKRAEGFFEEYTIELTHK